MTREEFMRTPSDFRFCLNPLDVNLAKMQKQLIDRMQKEAPVNGSFKTIMEEYTSVNPEREYGRMIVEVRAGERGIGYDVAMTVYSKDGNFLASVVIDHGTWEHVCRYIDSYPGSADFKWDFFSSCKAHALWTDYVITNFVKCINWEVEPQSNGTWMSFFYGRTGIMAFDAKVCHAMNTLYSDSVTLVHDMPENKDECVQMLTSLMQSSCVVKVFPTVPEFVKVPICDDVVLFLSEEREDKGTEALQLVVCWKHDADWEEVANSLLPLLYQTLKMKNSMVRIESRDDKQFIHGIKELEGCKCYSWGENLLYVPDNEYGECLVNKVTGKVRKIVERGKLVGFSDEEIDFETIDKLENSHNAHSRRIQYAGINRWTNCKNGLIALSWMLYPDGRYFADEDGYGMEDNDEVKVYCVLDENLQVVRPFAPVDDVPQLLDQLGQEKNENR